MPNLIDLFYLHNIELKGYNPLKEVQIRILTPDSAAYNTPDALNTALSTYENLILSMIGEISMNISSLQLLNHIVSYQRDYYIYVKYIFITSSGNLSSVGSKSRSFRTISSSADFYSLADNVSCIYKI